MGFNPFAAGGGAGGDYVHNYTTFDDLGIDTHGKTMEEILKEVADMNLPVNTIITGQLYTEAAPDERIYNCEGEIQITQGKYGQVYWCRATSASISPYSWDSIYNQTTDEDNPIDNILPWTPTYYQSTEINEIKKKLEELGADWVGRFERDEDGNILGEYFNDYENNKATGLYSHTEGSMNVNLGETGHVEGYNNQLNSTEKGSHVEGWENIVETGYAHHIEGKENSINSDDGLENSLIHIEGKNNSAKNNSIAHIEGIYNTIEGHSSVLHVEGERHNIIGQPTTMMGNIFSTALHVEGSENQVDDSHGGSNGCHIEGFHNKILKSSRQAYGAHIEGTSNICANLSSAVHIEGDDNVLSENGHQSHMEGEKNVLSGNNIHLQGYGNTAIGQYSTVGGIGNYSYGIQNVIFGGAFSSNGGPYFYGSATITEISDTTTYLDNISYKETLQKSPRALSGKYINTYDGNWPKDKTNKNIYNGLFFVEFKNSNGATIDKKAYYGYNNIFITENNPWPSNYDKAVIVGAIQNGNLCLDSGALITGTANSIITNLNTYNFTGKSYGYGFNTIEGVNNLITGACQQSHIEGGTNTIKNGVMTHVEGNNNYVREAKFSHNEGNTNTIFYSDNTHVEGCNNTACRAVHGHIEGVSNTIGSKNDTLTQGDTLVYGAHVEGCNNRVYATSGHAEGGGNTVLGKDGHAEGEGNTVYGHWSHAEGKNNTVYGQICHVSGSGNSVNGEGNFVCGENVITASDSAYNFILGVNNNNSVGSKNYGNLMCLSNSSVSSSYNVGLLQVAGITGGYNLVIGTQAEIDAENSILNMTQSNLRGAHFSYVNGYNNNITNKGSSTSQNSVCWIHGSLNNIMGGNTCLYGRQNDIYGYSNYILGDKNKTSYSTNEKKADAIYNNYIFGSRNILYSDKTRVSENNKIFGDNNFIDGNDNIILEASEKQDTLSLTSSVSISSCDSGTITLSSEWPDIDKYPIKTIFEISGYAIIVQLSSKTTLKVLKWYDGQDRDISEVLTGKSFNSIIPIKVFSNNSSGLFVVGGKNIAIAPENGRSGRSVLIHSSNYTEDFGGANVVINANNVSLQQSGSNIIFGKGSSTNSINMTYGSSGNIVYQHRSDSYANFSYVCEGNVSYGQEVNLTHASNNFISPAADKVSIGNIPVGEKNKNVILSCNEFRYHYDTIQKISSNTILNGDTHTINGSFNVCGVGSSDIVSCRNVDFGQGSVIKNKGDNAILCGNANKILSGKYIADDNYDPDDANRLGHYNAIVGNANTIYSSSSYVLGDANIVGEEPTEDNTTPSINSSTTGFSLIIGTSNNVKPNFNIISGTNNFLKGDFSAAFGMGHKVYGQRNFVYGWQNNVGTSEKTTDGNIIFGQGNTAEGQANWIMGNAVSVSKNNNYNYIFGNGVSINSNKGQGNFIAGWGNNIYKNIEFSSIFGSINRIGEDATGSTGTNYDVSHVFIAGNHLIVNKGANKVVFGCYNAIDTEDKFALVIGNGTAEDARSNAFAVSKTGDIYVKNSDTPIDLTPVPMSLLEEICV